MPSLRSVGMTAPMTMNRVIHGAVRRDLARLADALDRFPDGDVGRARDLARAFAHLHSELTRHHVGEDTHVWPMLAKAGADPDTLAAMEAEHHAMAQALADTDAAMTRLASTGAAADAEAARASVARCEEVVDQHLTHEEADIEPVMHRHENTPEWKAVEKKLRSQPPKVAGEFFAWVTDGMRPEHEAYFRSAVPAPVVFVLSRVFGRRYNREVAPVWRSAVPG
jgi:hemerythrin-like domain-containing protein